MQLSCYIYIHIVFDLTTWQCYAITRDAYAANSYRSVSARPSVYPSVTKRNALSSNQCRTVTQGRWFYDTKVSILVKFPADWGVRCTWEIFVFLSHRGIKRRISSTRSIVWCHCRWAWAAAIFKRGGWILGSGGEDPGAKSCLPYLHYLTASITFSFGHVFKLSYTVSWAASGPHTKEAGRPSSSESTTDLRPKWVVITYS